MYQSAGTPGSVAHGSPAGMGGKNETLPLGAQVPLAMGGGSPTA